MMPGKGKKLVIALGILFLVFIALMVILPKLLDLNRYKSFVTSKIEHALNGKVSLGHISWGISNGIWLETDRFSITETTSFPVDLDFSHIYAKVSIMPLLRKRIEISELRLEAPKAIVRLEPRSVGDTLYRKKQPHKRIEFDLRRLTGLSPLGMTSLTMASETNDQETWGKVLPVEISIEELSIHQGKVTLEDDLTLPGQKVERIFTDVEVEATGIKPGETAAFHVSFRDEATSGLGPFEGTGTFRGLTKTFVVEKPQLKMKGVFSSLHTDAIKPYLGKDALDHRLGGHVSLEVNYDGDFGELFGLEGVVDLTDVTFTDPSLWEEPIPGAETKIFFQAGFDPDGITIDKATLRVGNLSIAASAQIARRREQPVIKNAVMTADLAFRELAPLIPWGLLGESAQFLRPILESGGTLRIEELTLPEMDPALSFSDPAKILPKLRMTARLSDISVPPSPNIPKIEVITGMVQMTEGVAHIKGLKARALSTELPEISARITSILESPCFHAQVHGALFIPEALDDETKVYLNKAGITHLSGTADLDLVLEWDVENRQDFNLQGKLDLRDVHVKTSFNPASLEKVNSDLLITPKDIEIKAFSGNVRTPQTKTAKSEGFTLELKGKVEDWRRQPVVLLQHLSTSPVSLPSLVPLLPWKKLGDAAEPARKILLAGGTVTLNRISLPGINLKKPPKTAKAVFSQVLAIVSFSQITVKPSAALPAIEEISGRFMLEKGNLTATDMKGRMGPFTFPTVKAEATGLGGQIKAAVSLKGPMSVKGTSDVAIEELLRKYGLNSLSGTAEIDMAFQYDQKTPHLWSASGFLEFNKINAEAYPEAVRLEDLQGRIYLKKEETLELFVNKLTANINKAPVGLDAMLARGGTPQMLLQGKVYAKNLDLADVNAFLPGGDELKLTGNLDLDLDVRFPYANPVQTRLAGNLKTLAFGCYLKAAGATVKEGKADFAFVDRTVQLKHMSLKVNDQMIALKGSWTGLRDPKFFLHLNSPQIDVDRLISAKDKGQKPLETNEGEEGEPGGDQAPEQPREDKPELPLWAHTVTGDLQVELAQGVFKEKPFHGLKLDAHYERGVVKPYHLGFQMAKGQVQTQGCLDLRDLDKIAFVFDPKITALPLEALAPLFGLEKPPIYGPISATGRLRGDTLNPDDLVPGLAGTINMEVGAGRLPEIKQTGQFFASILSILNITGIFSGALSDTMRDEGFPFKSIHTAISMDGGKLRVDHFLLLSSALNVSSQGTIDLLSREVDMKVALAPFGTLDKIMGIVPILGKQAQKLTSIYLTIEGSLEDPKVKKTLAKGVGSVITSAITSPKTFIDKFSQSPKKDERPAKRAGEGSKAVLGCEVTETPGKQ